MDIQIQINKATALVELIRTHQEHREEVFGNRSDKWRENEKGGEYQEKTCLLEYFADDLENVIPYLEEYSES